MDKIAKLLKKISSRDRDILLDLVQRLITNDKSLKFVKLKNSDFYRLRQGNFRIIFHKDNGVVIDSIRLRHDNTYKNL
jgi:mRNA-degrading endonuclease RelE of RelBE toxin-antitoxin system